MRSTLLSVSQALIPSMSLMCYIRGTHTLTYIQVSRTNQNSWQECHCIVMVNYACIFDLVCSINTTSTRQGKLISVTHRRHHHHSSTSWMLTTRWAPGSPKCSQNKTVNHERLTPSSRPMQCKSGPTGFYLYSEAWQNTGQDNKPQHRNSLPVQAWELQ